MSDRPCPMCGEDLVPIIDGDGYECLLCGNEVSAEDAPSPTAPPLDVRVTAFGDVRLDTPNSDQYDDILPYKLNPDAARRLADALEYAAEDADQRISRSAIE